MINRALTFRVPKLVILIFAVFTFLPTQFVNASYFTLPIFTTGTSTIVSWFDHDVPDYSETGEMVWYDGTVFID